jgi:RIO kinase 2
MKLDATNVRYLSPEDYRVLTALEVGSKNHEVVPTTLIARIAKFRPGGVHKILSDLARQRLCSKENNFAYEGYRLTYGGYDYLALRTFAARETLTSVGHQVGMGKESDIFLGSDTQNRALILKLQRLGRTSFRSVRNNRDYAGKGRKANSASWMYLSRLAAQKEWAFMQALHARGFPVPEPVDQNRHCVVMGMIQGKLLDHIKKEDLCPPGVEDQSIFDDAVAWLYSELMSLILRLAEHGLIHGDFNEFNLIWEIPAGKDNMGQAQPDLSTNDHPGRIVIIDFPQMVSTRHPNAKYYFDRDVNCVRAFFERRFGFIAEDAPDFEKDVVRRFELDVELAASGFDKTATKNPFMPEETDEEVEEDASEDVGSQDEYESESDEEDEEGYDDDDVEAEEEDENDSVVSN